MARNTRSVESVLKELRPGIQRGRYAPGQRLITSELAAQLGTSLAPVREALHILAGEGLVELQPNRGARVRTLTPQVFVDGIQVLQVTGSLAMRLLAPRLKTTRVRDSITRAMKQIVDAGQRRSTDDFFVAVSASHRLVNEYSGNSYLNPILDRLHLEYFYRQMSQYLPDEFWQVYMTNYRLIGEALIRDDANAAVKVWVRHTDWIIRVIQKRTG